MDTSNAKTPLQILKGAREQLTLGWCKYLMHTKDEYGARCSCLLGALADQVDPDMFDRGAGWEQEVAEHPNLLKAVEALGNVIPSKYREGPAWTVINFNDGLVGEFDGERSGFAGQGAPDRVLDVVDQTIKNLEAQDVDR